MLDFLRDFFDSSSPMMRIVFSFSLILLAPRLFERFKLPGVLALIFVGVLFGPRGFHLFSENGQVLMMFALLGKLLLLFFSGLDIEFDILKKNLKKSLLVAAFAFTLPAIAGITVELAFGYSIMTSVMIGILFSSHSVIGYPILTKLGLAKEESVAVTIGATAITDISSLIVFAICLPIHTTGFLIGPFLLQILYVIVFIPAALYGFNWWGKTTFKHLGEDSSQQMIFLLLVVGISAGVAELLHIESIVGAFLAGLAVSSTLPNVNVRKQLDTMGNTLFIPAFFISLGVLIDPVIVIQTMKEHLLLVIAVVAAVVITKFLSAWLAGAKFGYSTKHRILMGSLMLPQVSSTLAVALVAYESVNYAGENLIDEALLNSILVLMVVSAIVGTVITDQVGERIAASQKKYES